MTRLLSQTLSVEDRDARAAVCCRGCGYMLDSVSRPWKLAAVLRARPLREVGAIFTTDPALLLREFVCPDCGALLDSEIALPDDPYLDDRLAP